MPWPHLLHSSTYHDVVDEPLLRAIAAEIQAAIPGAELLDHVGSRLP